MMPAISIIASRASFTPVRSSKKRIPDKNNGTLREAACHYFSFV
jgi:hypothetical protein